MKPPRNYPDWLISNNFRMGVGFKFLVAAYLVAAWLFVANLFLFQVPSGFGVAKSLLCLGVGVIVATALVLYAAQVWWTIRVAPFIDACHDRFVKAQTSPQGS